MNRLEKIEARRLILNWKDSWTLKFQQHLEVESRQLKAELHAKIDKIGFGNALFPVRYLRNTIEPLFTDWCQAKATELRAAAEHDLQSIVASAIPEEDFSPTLDRHSSKESLLDLAAATISTGVAAATVPAVIAFSTASVSVGGVLGFLGVSTTVIVTRNLLAGLLVLAALFLFTLLRFKSIKINARKRLKAKVDKQIIKKIHFSKKEKSLAMGMTKMLETTADSLVKELRHG